MKLKRDGLERAGEVGAGEEEVQGDVQTVRNLRPCAHVVVVTGLSNHALFETLAGLSMKLFRDEEPHGINAIDNLATNGEVDLFDKPLADGLFVITFSAIDDFDLSASAIIFCECKTRKINHGKHIMDDIQRAWGLECEGVGSAHFSLCVAADETAGERRMCEEG